MTVFRLSFFIYCLTLYSCALQVPPDGGAKDVLPPKIVSTVPENKALNFKGKTIRIDFDEVVSVSDLSGQLVISPLLKYTPEIKARKKTLYIEIEDTLLENTTYTMNFGSGIADNNEGNKLDDYQFVFSTGDILDTLSVSGNVIKAFDLTTEKGILVSLYRDENDSTPYIERPVYFSKTNESGIFRINNISPGTYSIFALNDADANYLYSPEEMFAFNNSVIQANDTGIQLRLFTETPVFRFLKSYSEFPGKAVFVFSGPADSVGINWITDTTKLQIYARSFSGKHDTLTIWYKNVTADSLVVSFTDKQVSDTAVIRLFKKTEGKSGKKAANEFVTGPAKGQSSIQHLHLPYYLSSNRPLASADFSKIILLEDSQPVSPRFVFGDSLHLSIEMQYDWKNKMHYKLFIPPATFTDIYNAVNDSVNIDFSSHSESDYGSVTFKFRKWEEFPYILQLVNADGSKIFRQAVIESDTTLEMLNLDPGEYYLKFVRDINANGKWDTGNYLTKIQPETVEYYNEPVLVRGNWDVELQMILPLPAGNK